MPPKQYDLWVIATAWNGDDCPGGEIKSAYCSCPAGLLGACNHLIALLLKVEAVHKKGLTSADTCTSVPCAWAVPSKKKTIEPGNHFHLKFS